MTTQTPASLADLQAQLQHYVLAESEPFDETPGNGDDLNGLLSELHCASPDAGKRRLQVYHTGYRLRMREVLQGAFEQTWAYLGDRNFDAICVRYIEKFPSHSPNLRDYGSQLPLFLERILPGDPEVAELATMDWRLQNAFDAPNAGILTGDQLATVDEAQWESLGFAFHPSVSLSLFQWNALEIWHALDQEQTPPSAQKLDTPIGHLFWRSDQRSYFRTLEPEEYAALKGLMAGESFARVCEQLSQNYPDTAIDAAIGTWLARWLADELLSEIMPGPTRYQPLSA